MSNAKLTAAREFIQEKQYAAARQILETMDDPTARKWLAQLNDIAPRTILPPAPPSAPIYAPPPPAYAISAEQEHYYRTENKRRRYRQIANGLRLISTGIGCWVFAALIASLPKYSIPGGAPSSGMSFEIFLFPIGLIMLVAGIIRIGRRG